MKNLIGLLLILIPSIVFSQSIEKNTAISLSSSPGSWDDGFNFGLNVEHQNRTIYVGAELFAHPWLNATGTRELSYYHLVGRVGLNTHINDYIRLFGGFRGGLIRRGNNGGYALLGGECGIDFIIPGHPTIFIRIMPTIEAKTDSKIYSRSPSHTVKSLIGSIGFKF